MKEPVDHIERPYLPWREGPSITECGINAKSVKTLSREDFAKRLKEYGIQRTALTTCMTCSQAAERWSGWDVEPREAMEREIAWEGCGGWWKSHNNKRGTELLDELKAIAVLTARHKEEFLELKKSFNSAINFFSVEESAKWKPN